MKRADRMLIRALLIWARALACAVALLCAPLGVTTATAQPEGQGADFDPKSESWTGLSRFIALAEAQGIEVELADSIDWNEQSPDEPIFLVYPTKGLEIANAANYVVDGGRILIADDFGASPAFLDRLDVSRVNVDMGELPHDRFVHGNRALPIFEPDGRHPLLEGVDTVVANHPAVLLNVGGPVVAYSEGGGLVYDMNLGEGKVVLLGDASLVINHMLSVADNSMLVQNTFDYLCPDREPCRAKLIVRDFDQYGRYTPREPDDDGPATLSAQLDELNEVISDFMEQMPAGRLLYYLSILLAGGLALYLAAVFRLRASRPYSEYVHNSTRDVPEPQSEFDWNLSRFGDGGRETNYALPLAIFKEVFEELFLDDLGHWPISAENRPSVEQLGREFGTKYLLNRMPSEAERLEQEVTDLLAAFARIPTRHRVFLDSDAYFSERDLIKIYRRTRRVLEIMGLEEEYERRTRSLV